MFLKIYRGHVGKGSPETARNTCEQPPKVWPADKQTTVSYRGWLHPQSCPGSERFSTVSDDGPDFGQILISPLNHAKNHNAVLLK